MLPAWLEEQGHSPFAWSMGPLVEDRFTLGLGAGEQDFFFDLFERKLVPALRGQPTVEVRGPAGSRHQASRPARSASGRRRRG